VSANSSLAYLVVREETRSCFACLLPPPRCLFLPSQNHRLIRTEWRQATDARKPRSTCSAAKRATQINNLQMNKYEVESKKGEGGMPPHSKASNDKQTHMQTKKERGTQTDRQTDRETDRQTDLHGRIRPRQIDRPGYKAFSLFLPFCVVLPLCRNVKEGPVLSFCPFSFLS